MKNQRRHIRRSLAVLLAMLLLCGGTMAGMVSASAAAAYTITYNPNGGSVSPTCVTVTAGCPATLPTPARPGYTFNGWYTASSGGTKIGNAGASYTPAASITLYAQWTLNAPASYTVNCGTGGGSYAAGATVNITAGAAPKGKVFDKWTATGVALANPTGANTSFTMPANNVTLTATYKDAPKSAHSFFGSLQDWFRLIFILFRDVKSIVF